MPRKNQPGYPDFIKRVKSKGRIYEYFDTGQTVAGKRVYKRLPEHGRDYGGVYAALLAARMRRGSLTEVMTIADLSRAYQSSREYRKRSESTQNTYLLYLRKIEDEMGAAPIGELERSDIVRLRDKMQATPGAANMALVVLRNMMRYALDREWISADPTDKVRGFDREDNEHEPWPVRLIHDAIEDDMIGLAVALLYYTGQRIGDVCQMRWSDIRGDFIHLRQQKVQKDMIIRVHSALRAKLDAAPKDGETILTGPKLRPMRVPTLRNRIQAFAKAQGLEVVPHGLRKNAVNTLLEVGCSTAEVSAITGQSLRMVEHYAKQRDNQALSSSAILRWEGNKA